MNADPVIETVTVAQARLEVAWLDRPHRNAPVIVFLHEGLGSRSLWRDYPWRLAAATGCGALVYSRRGYGSSTPHPGPLGTDYLHREATGTLPALLERYGIARPILYGHSDGASIALIHAGDSGAGVTALVLEAPHVFVEDISLDGVRAARAAFRTGELRDRLARHHTDPELTFRAWCDAWLDPAFAAWNIVACLGRITAPALLVQGEQDAYGTLRQLDAIARGLRGPSRRLVIPDCGHAPHREAPDLVLGTAGRFLDAVTRPHRHDAPCRPPRDGKGCPGQRPSSR